MAKLIFSAIASIDGYVEDERGDIDWAAPDEVHGLINDLERPIGTYLYGRRIYEAMVPWETMSTGGDRPSASRDFAGIWQAGTKRVYSRTLQTPSSAISIPRRSGGSRSRRTATSSWRCGARRPGREAA